MNRTDWTLLAIAISTQLCIVVPLAVIAYLAMGCGASQTETRYAAEVAHCLDNERSIVAREGTSADEDEADLDAERARCDATLAELLDAERAEVTDEAE